MGDAGKDGTVKAVTENLDGRLEQVREDMIAGENLTSESKKVIYPSSNS